MPALLEPAALLWRIGIRLRWMLARPYRARLPVVCVGNLTVGGAGKTPTAIAIAKLLKARGERPVFLTRGYGGKRRGPALVDQARDSADEVGDEPLLLADVAPTIISADRAEGARFAEGLEASVVVMDDGFHNPSLVKDLSLVVVDRATGVGNGLILPAGPLRASLPFQLAKANTLIAVGEGGAADDVEQRARARHIPILEAALVPQGETEWLKAGPVVAFAGIGHPKKFFRMLEEEGAELADRIAFPDHHRFTEKDARALLETATQYGAQLVTTEKDRVRLRDAGGTLRTLYDAARPLTVAMRFGKKTEIAALLDVALARRSARKG